MSEYTLLLITLFKQFYEQQNNRRTLIVLWQHHYAVTLNCSDVTILIYNESALEWRVCIDTRANGWHEMVFIFFLHFLMNFIDSVHTYRCLATCHVHCTRFHSITLHQNLREYWCTMLTQETCKTNLLINILYSWSLHASLLFQSTHGRQAILELA